MQAIVASTKNGKAMVLSFAEKNGHIKYMGYSDGWLHECGASLSAKKMSASPSSFGKPGHFDCRKCGAPFKKQAMLATQIEKRDEGAKYLISTVRLEHRNDKIGLIRFIVRSQSRPKAYLVKRDNHGNWTCGCEDFQVHTKYDDWHCKHILACEYHLEKESKADEPYDAIAHLETRFRCKVTGVLSAERINGNGSFKVVLSAKQKSGIDSTIDTTLDTATLKSLGWTPPKPKVKAKPGEPTMKQAKPCFRFTSLFRPSLICKGTQKEFETANRFDEAQIAQMNEGCTDGLSRAYLINGKVAISYYGTLTLAETLNIEVSDVQVKQASQGKVATAKATNPKTGVTQCGAHSQPTLLNGLMPDDEKMSAKPSSLEVKAIGKAKRNAILKVIPEVDVYRFANKYAQKPSDDLLCDGTEPMKASTQKKQNGRNTSKKGYWATTLDGDTVWVTKTGDNDSPVKTATKRASQRRSCPKCGDNIKGKGIYCSLCVGKMLGGWDGNTVNLPTTKANVRVPTAPKEQKAQEKIYVLKNVNRMYSIAKDNGRGFAGDVIIEGGIRPLNFFKNSQQAVQYARINYPDAKIITLHCI